MMMFKNNFVLLCLCGLACETSAWMPSLNSFPLDNRVLSFSTTRCFQSSEDADDIEFPQEPSEAQRQQEIIFEEMSLKGAKEIAKMEIQERTKRAMLAEVVEDRIFELTEVLEGFVDESGTVREEDREKAVEVALQTKQLQIQYNELVSGKQSAILDSLNSIDSLEK